MLVPGPRPREGDADEATSSGQWVIKGSAGPLGATVALPGRRAFSPVGDVLSGPSSVEFAPEQALRVFHPFLDGAGLSDPQLRRNTVVVTAPLGSRPLVPF